MIESIFAFLLSSNFTVLMTALASVLAVVSSYIGSKHNKEKKIVDMLIRGIEVANNPDTKTIIKDLSKSHSSLKKIDFDSKVQKITHKMKMQGEVTLQNAVKDIEEQTGVLKNLKKIVDRFI